MYEKTVTGCEKLRCLIQDVVKRNMNLISQNDYDKVSNEYGNIAKEYVITKDNNVTVDKVWNVYTKRTAPHPGVRKNISIKKEGYVRGIKIKKSQGRLQGRENKPTKKLTRKKCEHDFFKC